MTVWPATVNVPVREAPVVLAATLNVTEPMPEPLAPAVTVIQDVVVVAVQAQDVPEVTLSVRLLASASTAKLVGVTGGRAAGGPLRDRDGLRPANGQRAGARGAASCWRATLNVTEPNARIRWRRR